MTRTAKAIPAAKVRAANEATSFNALLENLPDSPEHKMAAIVVMERKLRALKAEVGKGILEPIVRKHFEDTGERKFEFDGVLTCEVVIDNKLTDKGVIEHLNKTYPRAVYTKQTWHLDRTYLKKLRGKVMLEDHEKALLRYAKDKGLEDPTRIGYDIPKE
jgi:hypothetical protein